MEFIKVKMGVAECFLGEGVITRKQNSFRRMGNGFKKINNN
ncbi:hypothetical protein ACFFVB_12720 [Formosa undariae]|uniref:Uncharacterized protein n=1 Tax=Formosa undariae TaxID=1325436 RepID=A0ABV5F3B5_9FLAO